VGGIKPEYRDVGETGSIGPAGLPSEVVGSLLLGERLFVVGWCVPCGLSVAVASELSAVQPSQICHFGEVRLACLRADSFCCPSYCWSSSERHCRPKFRLAWGIAVSIIPHPFSYADRDIRSPRRKALPKYGCAAGCRRFESTA